MKKIGVLTALIVAISISTFANDTVVEKDELSDTELAHVLSGVITLKSQCVNGTEDVCKQAEAVMKLFKRFTLENSEPNGELKNHMGLPMESVVDGYVEAQAATVE